MRKLWKTKIAGICLLSIVSLLVCLTVNMRDSQTAVNDETAQPVMTIEEKRQELEAAEGMYSEDSIVLSDTTKEQAEYLAEKLGARLRMTEAGDYAVLYLPEGVSIEDIYEDEEFEAFIPEMTPDYYASVNAEDARGNILTTARPNCIISDVLFNQQQYLDYLNLSTTWSEVTGANIKVAVIDSGIDTDHPEFSGRISQLSYNASEDKVVQDYGMDVIEDEYGHGTEVAGVLGAGINNSLGIVGVAPNVELVVIKCDVDEAGQFVRSSDLVFGLAYAIECDVDVVNMSFGTSFDIFSKYTQLAVDSDIICVAAAGNDGSSMPQYPAADENVIGVGSMDMLSWSLASYSNYGDNSDVIAPGTALTTALNGGYTISTGTSLSSPIVSGAVALYLARNSHIEFSEMEAMLQASSIDIGTVGEDWENGFGLLDIYALVCAEKGTITYDMLTDEVENQTQVFVRGRPVQIMPEVERENVVLDGWYFDTEATDECDYYTEVFTQDITLYASWINEDEGSAYIYTTLPDNTVEIREYTGRRRYLTVPEQIEGKTVSSIGEFAFAYNDRIRSVVLPDTLTNIGQYAFNSCTRLREIAIPEQVKTIGNNAFENCVSLSKAGIVQAGQLLSIGDYAFSMCGINSFAIPAKLSHLGEGVFYGSTSLRSVTVAEGNTKYQLKNSALYNASGDTLVYYPAGLTGTYTVAEDTTAAGNYAFAYSRSTEIILPENITVLGQSLFENAYIRALSIPASIQSLGKYMCRGCSQLGSVALAKGNYTKIPEAAFSGCYSLKTVSIPAQITKIDSSAFSCSGLRTVEFAENAQLLSIGDSAFSDTSVRSIKIPASVTGIESNAFRSCVSLSEVIFEGTSSCKAIEDAAFMYCNNIKEIVLPDSLTGLGVQVFYGTGLETVTIGAGLTSVGAGTFSGCESLSQILVAEGNPIYADFDGVLYNRECTELLMFPGARSGSYTLPTTTKRIADYAFAGAANLIQVSLNEGLTEISGFAFSNCSSLATPQLPSTLITIGENAFEYCSSMESELMIPKSVVSLGRFAFYMDYALTSIIIEPESELSRLGYGVFGYCGIEDFTVPGSISTMAQEVFVGCEKLIAVTFEADSCLKNLAAWTFDGADNLRQITFEEGSQLTNIEARAFEGLDKLERITLENCLNLTNIDNYAFNQCTALAEITLPESLTEIGRYAFYGCSALTEITIPANVTFIGRYAFYGCNNLNVYFTAATLPVDLQENWDAGILGYYMGVSGIQISGDWTYALTEDGKASIMAYTGSESNLVLTTMDGHEIVSIGAGAFRNNTALESVVLPETLIGIYAEAFSGTTGLGSISIPASVAIIDNKAFENSGIAAVSFTADSKLEVLGRYAFANTSNLTGISLPKGIEKIRDYTFYQSGIQTIEFDANTVLSEIGRFAFSKSALTTIALPDSLVKIDYNAFKEAASLETVDFGAPSELMVYGEAFYNTGLTSVSIPVGVTYLGEFCFTACPNLTDITVAEANEIYCSIDGVLFNEAATKLITCPAGKTGSYTIADTVTTLAFAAFEGSRINEIVLGDDSQLVTIGYRAFYDCDALTAVNIPDSVMSLDNYAFAYCDNLATVTVNESSQMAGIYKGVFYNCVNLTEFLIPDSVQEIGDYAFYGCAAMANVQLNQTSQLKMIGEHAFEYAGITTLTMPPQLQEIGSYAFNGAKIASLTFNDTITYVGDYAFADCGLAETSVLKFPETVDYIGIGALSGGDSIEELTIPFIGSTLDASNSTAFVTLFGGQANNLKKLIILGGTRIPDMAFWGHSLTSLECIVLPETIMELGVQAFEYLYNLKSVNIPNGVTEIPDAAFRNTGIEDITLPNGIVEIGWDAFSGCEKLRTISLPNTLKLISRNSFYGCISLESITIPASVTSIDSGAFSACSNLAEIEVDPNNENYTSTLNILFTKDMQELVVAAAGGISGSLVIPEGVKTIQASAFAQCRFVTDISFPESLEYIGGAAFSNCDGLVSVSLPETVQEYGNQVFSFCDNLEEAIVESQFDNLGSMFSYCPNLRSIELSEGIVHLGRFSDCASLEELSIPDSVQTLESLDGCTDLRYLYIGQNLKLTATHVFLNCSSLEFIEVSDKNPYYVSEDGILYDKNQTMIYYVPCGISGSITIAEGVLEIGMSAFQGCTQLESITLPDSVKMIGDEAFQGCENLNKLIFGPNIESIGENILDCCTEYLTDQRNWINGLLYIGDYAIESAGEFPKAYFVRNGTKYIGRIWSPTIEYLYLPDSVQYIANNAFYGSTNLKSVRMSENIRKIGSDVFCSANLTSVVIPSTTESIGLNAFMESGVRYIVVESTASFGEQAFFVARPTYECAVIPSAPSGIRSWFGLEGTIPNKIVLTSTDALTSSSFSGISGVTIYLYDDDGYSLPEGWNNGNTVHYRNEWKLATFYLNDVIIQMDPIMSGEVLRTPAQSLIEKYLLEGNNFIGWDINGDGKPDTLPATQDEDLEAVAILETPITAISTDETATMEEADTLQLSVVYEPSYNNGNEAVIWTSSDETIATVDENGLVTALAEGEVTITVTLRDNEAVSDSCAITVTPLVPGIRLSETTGCLNVGETKKLEPRFVLLEEVMDTLSWTSGDETVATVESDGTITAVGSGTTEIMVTCGEYSAIYTLTVLVPMTGIEIPAPPETINVGETAKLSVSYMPENTTDDKTISWRSSNSKVAKVSDSGELTAVAPGSATITARVGSFTAEFEVTVYAPLQWIKLNTTVGTMRLDRTKQLEVIYEPSNTTDDRTVVWTTSDKTVASVNESGVVTAHKSGTAVITGTVGEHQASYSVTVVGVKHTGTGIIVTNEDNTPMNLGTILDIFDVANDDPDAAKDIENAIEETAGTGITTTIYDITLSDGEGIVQPTVTVDVEIPVSGDIDHENVKVHRKEEDGTFTDMKAEKKDGYLTFKTDHFSVYVVSVAHNFTNYVSDGNATCIEDGTMTAKCDSCDERDTKIDVGSKGQSHTWDTGVVTTEATCTIDGTKTYTCQIVGCGATKTETVGAVGHGYSAVVTDPTCTEKGYTTHTCSKCGDSYTDSESGALGHSWDEGIVTQDPTGTQNGCRTYTCSRCTETREESIPRLENPFEDVETGIYYYEPVLWAVEHGITTGATETTFMPEDLCTRAQVVTFLWRQAGYPEPESTQNQFSDVTEDTYYYKAVLWAAEEGITTGTSDSTFSPDDPCTRAQVVTFLWRAAGKPSPVVKSHDFVDITQDDYYFSAVLWAMENNITNGVSTNSFAPEDICTRAHAVTFLYRYFG